MPVISGITKDSTGTPVAAIVRAHNRGNGALVGEVVSNAMTGAYSIVTPDASKHVVTRFNAPVIDVAGDPNWSSVVLAMRFDGPTFVDERGHTMTAGYGASFNTSEKVFGASSVEFNGTSNSVVSTPNSVDFNFRTGDFTVDFFIKASFWGGVAGQKANDGSSGWQIYRNGSSNTTKMAFRTMGTLDYFSFSDVSNTQFNHWRLERNGTLFAFFHNGELDSIYTGITWDINDTSAPFYIGYSQTWAGRVTGKLDDLIITKGLARQALLGDTPTEGLSSATDNWGLTTLAMNFEGTNGGTTFTDEKGHTVTPTGSVTTTTSAYAFGSSSGNFSINSKLTIPASADFDFGTGDFTIEFNIFPNPSGGFETIIGRWVTASPFLVARSGTTLTVFINGSSIISIASALPSGIWSFVQVIRKGGKLFLRVDGVFKAFYRINSTSLAYEATNPLHIGCTAGDRDWFNGKLDRLRLVKAAVGLPSFAVPTGTFLGADTVTLGSSYDNAEIFDDVTPV